MSLRLPLVPVLAVGVVAAMSLTVHSGSDLHALRASATTEPGATEVADAYVASAAPNTNFGHPGSLQENATASKTTVSYVTFDVEGLSGPPDTATLKLYSGSNGVIPTVVSAVSGAWTESGITWDNRPALGAEVGTTGHLVKDQWIQADVSGAVSGNGLVSFALTTKATATRYVGTQPGIAPQLILTTGSTPPTTTSTPPTTVGTPPTTIGTPPTTVGTPPTTVGPTTTTVPAGSGHVTKILTIMEENHSLAEMQAGMPYLDSLGGSYAQASDYKGISHPSLPNYLSIAGGTTFGVTDDAAPSVHHAGGQSVFDQAIAAGKTAKSYDESMTSNCELTSSGNYAVKHNPWAYFNGATERANCNRFDVPAGSPNSGALAGDIANGTLPNVGMLTPNLIDDAHDGTLADADNYLQAWLPQIIAGRDFQSGALAVVIVADEDDSSQGNKVLTVVVSKSLQGTHTVVGTALNHYSLSALYSHMVGAQPLASGASAADMGAAFKLLP